MNVKLRLATKADDHLPWLDYTKASAINTCPMFGLVKFVARKTTPGEGRNTALETGSACHDAFAAARFAQLFEGRHREYARIRAEKHFGSARHDEMWKRYTTSEALEQRRTSYALEALHTAGYYDDPRDRRRTLANIEEACIAYLQRYDYDNWETFVHEDTGFIGVEVPFDIVVEADRRQFRFVGRADGIIHHRSFKRIEVHENKTGARINDAWSMSFHMSHQVTGYLEAAKLTLGPYTREPITHAVVHGLQIPLPRDVEIGGIVFERVSRHEENVDRWLAWLIHTYDMMMEYSGDRLLDAPQYTHSCNRYFRPCQFIAFCSSTREEQEMTLHEEFVPYEWTPLEAKTD